MLKINHKPIFNEKEVCKLYEIKDKVPIKYVCTTDLRNSDIPHDIFYREDGSSHPIFGNQYFGLYRVGGAVYITNADIVEDLDFAMIKYNGIWHYSRSHHDFIQLDHDHMIDGGRVYARGSLNMVNFVVCDGVFRRTDK